MFSYSRDYGKMTPEQKAEQAVKDAREYLGDEKFDLLMSEMRAKGDSWPEKHGGEPYPFFQFAMWCDFCGVRGYPIRALWDHCFPARAREYETVEEI